MESGQISIKRIIENLKDGISTVKDLEPSWLLVLAKSENLNEEIVRELFKKKGSYNVIGAVAEALGKNENVKVKWLLPYIDEVFLIRGLTERKSELTEEEFLEIFNNGLRSVQMRLFNRADIPLSLATRIVKEDTDFSILTYLVKNQFLPKNLEIEICRSKYESVRRRLTMSKNLCPEAVFLLCSDTEIGVRQEMAKSELLTTKEIELLANDEPEVTRELATNRRVSREVASRLATKSRDWTTRYIALALLDVEKKILKDICLGRSFEFKRAVFLNKGLGQEDRLFLAVDERIIEDGTEVFEGEIELRRETLPVELYFTYPGAMSTALAGTNYKKAWTKTPGNPRLNMEIRNWPAVHYGGAVHFCKGKAFQKLLEEEEKGVKFNFSPNSCAGWKGATDNAWWVAVDNGVENTKGAQLYRFLLPKAADGWMEAGKYKEGEEVFIMGATTGTEEEAWYWESQGKKEKELPIKFPIFSKNFEEINKVSANERIEANLEGMIFCGGGLYALWERGDKLLGWTAERTADTIPLKKTLKKKDFIDKYKENGRIALFEKIFKEIAVQQINL